MPFDVPLFVDPNDVIGRMQLDPQLSGVTDVVSSAIKGAQLHIEAYLDGDTNSGVQPGGVFLLEVPSGFVREDTPIVIQLSETTGSASDGFFLDPDGPFGGFAAGDPRFYRIDVDRGYIYAEAGRHRDRYVHLVCDTGFESGSNPLPIAGLPAYDPATTYQQNEVAVYQGLAWEAEVQTTGVTPGDDATWSQAFIPAEPLPPALYEAVLTMVPSIMAGQVANQSSNVLPQYEKAADHARLLLRDYVRVKGFAFRPIWS
jgi:hypothetical protein